jgi:hypothetical protein
MRLLTLPLTLAIKAVRGALSVVRGSDDGGPTPTRVAPRPTYVRQPRGPSGNGGTPPAPAEPPAPAHVSEEPELVAEVAEPGAEDGAGAELHVDAPWPDYTRMTAAEICGRLRGAGAEVATAVSLYEASHKGRSSVLEEASRRISAQPSG